jgi:hypothetical protein
MSLSSIGKKHKTDKATHGYLDHYDVALSALKDLPIQMLEIGIQDGFSLKMWEEYFPQGMIYGVDIHNKEKFDTTRIKTFTINQENKHHLSTLPKNLDFIIDDGGHTMLQQQVTINTLFNHLKPKGIYILEDLHTSNPVLYPGYGSNSYNNTLQLLKDLKSGKPSLNSRYFISEIEFNKLLEKIESIEIIEKSPHSITAIILKKESTN